MALPRIYKDPVHGQMRYEYIPTTETFPGKERHNRQLSWLIQSLIDTPIFQRLRHIRQNGLANFVFHGAEHSRFGHSMGVAFLAKKMYDRIVRNGDLEIDEEKRLATVTAALLHDIGHGPFSHAIEDTIKQFNQFCHGERNRTFNHENMTVRLITECESPIYSVLKDVDPSFPSTVAKYINKMGREEHWSHKIVSSQLDADRLDYLLRDATFAGLQGHGFDIERLLDMLRPHGNNIAIDRKAIEAVESYLIMLDQMYRAVYFHHTVRSASVLLDSILKRAFELHLGKNKVFSCSRTTDIHPLCLLFDKGEEISLIEYARLSDFHVWQLVESWSHSADDPILKDLCTRLIRRNLFKTEDIKLQSFNESMVQKQEKMDSTIKNIQHVTADTVKYYVVIDEPSRSSYKRYDWRGERPDESIWLEGGNQDPVPIERDDESKIIDALKNTRYFTRLVSPKEI